VWSVIVRYSELWNRWHRSIKTTAAGKTFPNTVCVPHWGQEGRLKGEGFGLDRTCPGPLLPPMNQWTGRVAPHKQGSIYGVLTNSCQVRKQSSIVSVTYKYTASNQFFLIAAETFRRVPSSNIYETEYSIVRYSQL
jgi:hypothetical protein